MNKKYVFKKVKEDLDMDNPLWEKVNVTHIDCYDFCEVNDYPRTTVQGVYSDKGISLLYKTDEKEVLARYTKLGDPGYKDSCVEFFFNPCPDINNNYFNFEVGAGGGMKLGFGPGRGNRPQPENAKLELFNVQTRIDEDGWQACFFIPFSFVLENCPEFSKNFKGNFQKCGDETACEHYPTWNKIDVPKPDFHRPEFFGDMILE